MLAVLSVGVFLLFALLFVDEWRFRRRALRSAGLTPLPAVRGEGQG
jgi:hypothetical protein